jgi:DNA/RNA endonuclease YhcR with UshA esterase domain
MEDNQIFKIAFLTSIIGLVGMVAFAGQVLPKEVKIKDIDRGMLDEDVSVEAVVQDVGRSQKGDTYFLDIMDDTGKTKLVIFSGTATDLQKENISVQNLDKRRISIVGTVNEYKGSTELVLKDSKSLKVVS